MYKKSKYTFETIDKDGNMLVCNLLYKSKFKIEKNDEKTLNIYKNFNDYQYNELKSFLDMKVIVDEFLDEDEELLKAKQIAYDERNKVLNITIKPTIACNLSCIYCWQSETTGNMTWETMTKLLKFIDKKTENDINRVVISWFGGEPMLMYDNIIRFMAELKKICNKRKISYLGMMSTNGTLINAERLENLLKHHVYSFQITLDGAKELHDKSRPCKAKGISSFDTIMKNLIDIRDNVKYNTFHIIVRVNITNEFYDHMSEFMEIYKKEFSKDNRFPLLLEDVTNKGGEKIKKNSQVLEHKFSRDYLVNELMKDDIIQHNFMNYGHGTMACNLIYDNSYNVNYDGMFYLCELLSDKFNTKLSNNLGYLDDEGNLEINHLNKLNFINSCDIDCKNCKLYPICLGALCPVNQANIKTCHYINNLETIENSLKMLSKENKLLVIKVE